jgi:hypothetical protein
VEERVIPEPQKTYVLELLHALGTTADEFVVAGAQAMKFMMERARATKDIDFVLDVVRLRSEPLLLGAQLEKLGYAVVDGSRNFQFEKPIPNSRETMRIEFMAPEEFRRAERDFRVDIQKGVHARACTAVPSRWPSRRSINSQADCQTAQISPLSSGSPSHTLWSC